MRAHGSRWISHKINFWHPFLSAKSSFSVFIILGIYNFVSTVNDVPLICNWTIYQVHCASNSSRVPGACLPACLFAHTVVGLLPGLKCSSRLAQWRPQQPPLAHTSSLYHRYHQKVPSRSPRLGDPSASEPLKTMFFSSSARPHSETKLQKSA